MKTIAYNEFGGTNVLQTIEVEKPAARTGHVLVKVKAVSINPLDWKIRKGEMKLMSGSKFPKHTGTDFSGVIDEVGESVTGFKKGDEVFGLVKNNMKEGSLGDYVLVPATHIWKNPAGIDFAQAASIPTVGFAAAMTLDKVGKVSSNSNILINGAAGGFGMFLLQLLKNTRANTTAVVGSNAINIAKEWGANSVVNYEQQNILEKGIAFDIVIDLSGRMGYANARKIMKPKSVFINPIPSPVHILTNPIKNLFRGKKHIVLLSAPSDKYSKLLVNAIDDGLQIVVNKVFPFSQTKEAYEYAEKGGVIGKVVIELK